jgi:uncharacterized protein YndB with AHSA1/START domain
MSDTATENGLFLRLERSFDASREDVFDAWTNPEVLKRWWAGEPDWDGSIAEVDLRVGGTIRLGMHDPEADVEHVGGGEFTEVSPHDRIAYTWTWENGESPDSVDSLVAVDFLDQEDGRTTVVLTHSGFKSAESRDSHTGGWNACLDNLEARVFPGG